ncbi:MAG: Mur ligase family protein [Desulfosalsimonadaceae bacterium]
MNHIPPRVESVHLIAACGTAMGALACMLKEMGIAVTGSDHNVYPPMSTYLEGRGIPVAEGFDASNVAYGPDLVVVGNAVKRDNPEVQRAREMGLAYCSLPQAVNRFLTGSREAVLVLGTHGKTTTAAMIAWLLEYAGLSPGFMIGGVVNNFGGNYQAGSGGHVVLEADEYDTAFFDKQPKFMHYDPAVAVLTGVEFDHADIYRDITQVEEAFERFLAGMHPDSLLIAYDNDPRIDAMLSGKSMRVLRYGSCGQSDWRLKAFSAEPPWTYFEPFYAGTSMGRFRGRFAGVHNSHNALAALAVCHELKIPDDVAAAGLERFEGVRRRQELRGMKNGVAVIDDFAHHPTAVRETIRAVRPFYPGGRLIAVFEPRTNTSRRKVFQDIYPHAFDDADLICIRKPTLLSGIPEDERFCSRKLAADICARGKEARYFEDTGPIVSFLAEIARSGDCILVMSNGGFDNIHERLLDALPAGDSRAS